MGLQLKPGGQIELNTGQLDIESDVQSEGMLSIKGGEMRFTKATGRSVIGGSGMTVLNDARVDVEKGSVEFGKEAPLTSLGGVEGGVKGKISFGESARYSKFTFSGSVADIADTDTFKVDFQNKVSAVLGLAKSRIKVIELKNATGKMYFHTKYQIADAVGGDTVDSRTDEQRQALFKDLMIQTHKVVSAESDIVDRPNTVGGKGMFVKPGGHVELQENAFVTFKNVSSDGLLDLKHGSKATFDSMNKNVPSAIRGQGIRTTGKLEVKNGLVRIEAPIRSTGDSSRVTVKPAAEMAIHVRSGQSQPSEIGGQGLKVEGQLTLKRDMSGPNATSTRPKLTIRGRLDMGSTAKLSVDGASTLQLDAPVDAKGRFQLENGGSMDLVGNHNRTFDGQGVDLAVGTQLKVLAGVTRMRNVSSRGDVMTSASSTLDIGGSFAAGKMTAKGAVQVEGPAEGGSNRRLLVTATTVPQGGMIVEGNTIFSSETRLTIPASASITFRNAAGSATVSGQGIDNYGTLTIAQQAAVKVSAGGVRSQGSIALRDSGSSFHLDSSAPSTIAGQGIDVGAGAVMMVSRGTVSFSAALTGVGAVTVGGSAKVEFSQAIGGCPTGISNCTEVITTPAPIARPKHAAGAVSTSLSSLVVATVLLATVCATL